LYNVDTPYIYIIQILVFTTLLTTSISGNLAELLEMLELFVLKAKELKLANALF
jgi:hypothetical protein